MGTVLLCGICALFLVNFNPEIALGVSSNVIPPPAGINPPLPPAKTPTSNPTKDSTSDTNNNSGCNGPNPPANCTDITLLAPFPGQSSTISTRDKGAIEILGVYISQIFTFGMALIVIFAVIMIMFAGYEYMFAGGDSSKTDNAKSRIVQALLGIILVFLSALLLNIINPTFYKL